jgi:hypothetical protein
MVTRRPAPRILFIETRGERALIRPGGSAWRREVLDLANYVLADVIWSPTGKGYVISAAAVPDVQAGAEIAGGWIVRYVKGATCP